MALAAIGGCVRRHAAAIAPAAVPSDNSYLDLKAGGKLRVVLPLRNGDSQEIAGFQMIHYDVEAAGEGRVRLKFTSAATTVRSGTTTEAREEPALPFRLPRGPRYIRLVYLVRLSRSDHDMAVLAALHADQLNAFTQRLKDDPGSCRPRGSVSCFWVPPGVAVRPED